VLDQAVESLPPGGEQIIGVFDLRGFELKNADLQFAAFIIEAFFEYYPRRWGGGGSGWGGVGWGGVGGALNGFHDTPSSLHRSRSLHHPLPSTPPPFSILSPARPRMGQVLMVDSPWIFKPTWEVIKPL
jgi:hypothetical protein